MRFSARYRQLPYDPVRDFAPITELAENGLVLVAHPGVPANSVSELIALAKKQHEKLNIAVAGATGEVAGNELKIQAKIGMTYIPYKGGAPAVIAVMSLKFREDEMKNTIFFGSFASMIFMVFVTTVPGAAYAQGYLRSSRVTCCVLPIDLNHLLIGREGTSALGVRRLCTAHAKTGHSQVVRTVSAVVEVICWVSGYKVNRAAEMPPFHRLKQGTRHGFLDRRNALDVTRRQLQLPESLPTPD